MVINNGSFSELAKMKKSTRNSKNNIFKSKKPHQDSQNDKNLANLNRKVEHNYIKYDLSESNLFKGKSSKHSNEKNSLNQSLAIKKKVNTSTELLTPLQVPHLDLSSLTPKKIKK